MTRNDSQSISRDRAKQLIDECDRAVLIVGSTEPKEVLGTVPLDEQEFEVSVERYDIDMDMDAGVEER